MISKLETKFVDTLPLKEDMVEGVFYLSERTWSSTHLNPFNPDEEVITPHVRGGYRYHINKNKDISITPDIITDSNITYRITQGYAILSL